MLSIRSLQSALGLASIAFLMVGITIWKEGKKNELITPGEYDFHETNHRFLGCLYSAIMILFTFPYLSIQIIGGVYTLENLTNGETPYFLVVIMVQLYRILFLLHAYVFATFYVFYIPKNVSHIKKATYLFASNPLIISIFL